MQWYSTMVENRDMGDQMYRNRVVEANVLENAAGAEKIDEKENAEARSARRARIKKSTDGGSARNANVENHESVETQAAAALQVTKS